uniref:Uncharacterized protein n=1 Tax=Timema monikensis TaxID=170555 RepID=A0A7R9EFK6_9NEOP|nr:unnamed protein product [Timema monikensis]
MNDIWENIPSAPGQDSNLNLNVIGISIYLEPHASDHMTCGASMAIVILSVLAVASASLLYGGPGLYGPTVYGAPSLLAVAPVVAPAPGYVAATRGSLHVAPLPGMLPLPEALSMWPPCPVTSPTLAITSTWHLPRERTKPEPTSLLSP